jgi:hypothetical protein
VVELPVWRISHLKNCTYEKREQREREKATYTYWYFSGTDIYAMSIYCTC